MFFPTFANVPFYTHVHFIIFLSWFSTIIIQPLLIKKRNYKLHKKIGRISYLLAPIMAVSILTMIKIAIDKNLIISKEQTIMAATGAILDTLVFLTCYFISMFNSKNIRWHVAFIIGAALIVFNPGLGRLTSQLISQEISILIMVLVPIMISSAIIIYEKIRSKRNVLNSPYLLFAIIWILEVIAFVALPQFTFWQSFIQMLGDL